MPTAKSYSSAEPGFMAPVPSGSAILAVLEAYLDQRMGLSWRGQLQESERRQSASDRQPSNMTPAEAYEILGLAAGAKRDEIQAAYRRLIQRLHPDQGGSAYLAACLNRARDVLLG